MRLVHIALAGVLLASAANAGNVIAVTGSRPDSNGGFTPRKTAVDIGELDLNKGEDAPAILERLKRGVESVCTPHEQINFGLADKVERCKKRALAETLHILNAPELSKLVRKE
jgi:UrcA family protein